jgi:hypothetical protein
MTDKKKLRELALKAKSYFHTLGAHNEYADSVYELRASISEKDVIAILDELEAKDNALRGIQELTHGGDSDVYQVASMALSQGSTEVGNG